MADPENSAHPAAESDSRSPYAWLASVTVLAFVGLGAWLMVGAMVAPERAAFAVDPRFESAPALASAVSAEFVPERAPHSDGIFGNDPGSAAPATVPPGTADRVDADWADRTAAATGIPVRALLAYAGAELALASEVPNCGVRWSTLAALGLMESAHGTHAGSAIGEDGTTFPAVFGIDLTGSSSARITDTDGGTWDGKADIDRAVGPMQFIPATWETWGADGNRDGMSDPQQIDDATLAAARYLCHEADMTQADGWRRAVVSYNHLDTYVDAVAQAADDYASRAGR